MTDPLAPKVAERFRNHQMAKRLAAKLFGKVGTVAMEHSSPEEMKKYLHEHPGADPKNHTVKKPGGGEGGGGAAKGGEMQQHVGHLAKSLKQQTEHSFKMGEQAKKLYAAFDKATGDRHGKEKAQQVAEKLNQAHHSALTSADVAITHGQSVINLAKKHGGDSKVIGHIENDLQAVEKHVKEMKERGPLKGEFHERMQAGSMSKDMGELHMKMVHLQADVDLLSKL
jgi:hypothetical protein